MYTSPVIEFNLQSFSPNKFVPFRVLHVMSFDTERPITEAMDNQAGQTTQHMLTVDTAHKPSKLVSNACNKAHNNTVEQTLK